MIGDLEALSDPASLERIVTSGAKAGAKTMRMATDNYHHVSTGQMRDSIQPGPIRKDIGMVSVEIGPKGDDGRGVSNAKKAHVIDRGIGTFPKTARSRWKAKNKTGDKFIRGKKTRDNIENNVGKAMEYENKLIMDEINAGK